MRFSERQLEALGENKKARERIEHRPHRRIEETPEGGVRLKYLPTAPSEEADVKDELFGKQIEYKEEEAPSVDLSAKEPAEWEYERAKKENGTVPLDREKENIRRGEKEQDLFEEAKEKQITFFRERFGIIEEGEVFKSLERVTGRLEKEVRDTHGLSVRLKPVLVNSLDIDAFVFNRDTLTRAAVEGGELPIFMNMGLLYNYQQYLEKKKRVDNGSDEDEKYRLTEDKIAFIMAHELGHLFQAWEKVEGLQESLESAVREKDADQRGFRLMNEAG